MMPHSFAPTFYMPEGADPYDLAPKANEYPTTLAEAILALDEDEFEELCERAGVYLHGELAWHECMEWVRDVVNSASDHGDFTRIYTDEEGWESVDVYTETEAERHRPKLRLVWSAP